MSADVALPERIPVAARVSYQNTKRLEINITNRLGRQHRKPQPRQG